MEVILVFVSTLDGKVTKWGEPKVSEWTSNEDRDYFKDLWKKSSLIVMGSNTYRAEKVSSDNHQRIVVMTRHPEKFGLSHSGSRFEFSNELPFDLFSRMAREGHERMVVVGGPHIATSFIREKLIDEIWLTIEPRLFGSGGNFIIEEKMDVRLKLISCVQAGDQGTLFTKYKVLK